MKFFAYSVLSVFLILHAAFSAEQKAGLWDRFEQSLSNHRQYSNPYQDVTLEATCISPKGKQTSFRGFYDGGNTWKIRFMPDQLGEWKYSARFSDGSGEIHGTFECVLSSIPGMIHQDETNPIWFGYRGGKHVFIRSLHIGDRFFAENWENYKREAFLDWAQEQKYNMLSIASHYLNRNSAGRGRGWKTPDLYPLNAEEFQKLEIHLDELAQRHILVYPFAGFFGRDSDFPRDPEEQELYIQYTLARLAPYWNVLFNVAGPEPELGSRNYLEHPEVERLGRLIREPDPFRHLIGVHNPSGNDLYLKSEIFTYGILQGPKTLDRKKLHQHLLENHRPNAPLYAQETVWWNNQYHPNYTLSDLRKNAYVCAMSAAALNFADMSGNSSSGFSGSMNLELRDQDAHDTIGAVWDFFESIPYYRMSPAQGVVDNGYCLAETGKRYLVYLEHPGSVNINVTDGPYQVIWINAQDTSDRRNSGLTEDGKGLQSPSDGEDWLLYLTEANDEKRQSKFVFSVNEDNNGTLLNGKPFQVVGLRVSNALVSDEKTQELIDNMDLFAATGINTMSVFFQGSRFGDVRGYHEDGTLSEVHANRMAQIIEAADDRGMVVLTGCFYYSTSKGKWENWDQETANRAVANTIRWLREKGYRNVFVDVNNEHMADFDDAQLIAAGKAVDSSYVIATSGRETPENADLSIHHGRRDIPNTYYIETEGTGGNYWGSYSKREGLYDYINIGVYDEKLKQTQINYATTILQDGQGFIFASTWLQCPPPGGPHHRPGGFGTEEDPGVQWMLNFLHSKAGRYHGYYYAN